MIARLMVVDTCFCRRCLAILWTKTQNWTDSTSYRNLR